MRIAVIGAGWAGLSAAVEATDRGHQVTLFEMAGQLGGRARRVDVDGMSLDNGQHILIGAYVDALRLMRRLGVDTDEVLLRTPLRLVGPDGAGLALPAGSPRLAFARAVLGHRRWRWPDKFSLLKTAGAWASRGFACDEQLTVAQLCSGLSTRVRAELIEPLCVAALNTPADEASAGVFLRVLHDALFTGPGSADMLLPRRSLSELLPEPAAQWLHRHGASVHLARRVETLRCVSNGWLLDETRFDAAIIATSAVEAARLVEAIQPPWADQARGLCYEPIITIYARSAGAKLSHPMLALPSGGGEVDPAQFVFDLGALGRGPGLLAFVISGARRWVARGMETATQATMLQAERSLSAFLHAPLEPIRALTEKRATFACTPALRRPSALIAPGLVAAGDYVAGPYPATLEGAVRSGIGAAAACNKPMTQGERRCPASC